MSRIGTASVGTSVPDKVLTNLDLERMVDTSDEWIVTRTGIRERHVLDRDEGLRPHVLSSARTAMEKAGIGPGDRCASCLDGRAFERARALGSFRGQLRELVLEVKYRRRATVGQTWAGARPCAIVPS